MVLLEDTIGQTFLLSIAIGTLILEVYVVFLYELIDDNDLNFCGKQILKQTIERPETTYKQVQKL